MNWQDQIDAELNRIAGSGQLGHQPVVMSVPTGHGTLRCQLIMVDTLSCAVNQLRFQTDALAEATVDQLRQLGEALAQRLRYLLEPIGNLELDREGFALQLRSEPPQQDDGGRRYYELTARRGGEICLCRYAKHTDLPRQQIPTTVTREVLKRLAQDFDAAAVSLP